MSNATCLLINSSNGVYTPKTFASNFEGWQGISEEDFEILADVDHEHYWETWDIVLNNAYYIQDGNRYTLYQDDDLFAVCVGMMTEEEQEEFLIK